MRPWTHARRLPFTHSYVLSETMTLLDRHFGREGALRFAAHARAYEIDWVDEPLHDAAVDALRQAPPGVSLVDQVSFLVMRRHGVVEAFAFDSSFIAAGFRLYLA